MALVLSLRLSAVAFIDQRAPQHGSYLLNPRDGGRSNQTGPCVASAAPAVRNAEVMAWEDMCMLAHGGPLVDFLHIS